MLLHANKINLGIFNKFNSNITVGQTAGFTIKVYEFVYIGGEQYKNPHLALVLNGVACVTQKTHWNKIIAKK